MHMSKRTTAVLLIAVVALGAMAGVAAADGHLEVAVDKDADGTSTVTVTENDTAVENATVNVSVVDPANESYAGAGDYETDANGSVDLEAPAEDVTVEVTAVSGNDTVTETVDLEAPDGLELDVENTDGEPVVTVTDNDTAVENASVNVTAADENATYVGAGDYETDENGTVTLDAPEEDVTIDVTAEIGRESRSIAIETDVGEHGVYRETVPLPGTYETDETSITVSENDVQNGVVRSAFDGEGYAYWSFNEGSSEWAYDRVGGHHGQIHGAEWTDQGRSGSAMLFGGKDSSDFVEAPTESLQEFSISLWAYPTALGVTENNDWREIVSTAGGSILIFEETGTISFRLPGVDVDRVYGGGIRTDRWQHVAITFDGSVRTIYLDGEQRARDTVSVGDLNWGGRIRLGNQFETPSGHGYAGMLDQVRIYDRVLSPTEIDDLH